MKLFDSHVHIYPEKIAEKASRVIGEFYDIKMDFDGSVPALLKNCEEAGIDMCLVHSVATTKEQVNSINNFISNSVNEHPDKFVGFCTLHPSMSVKEAEEEIERVISLGLKGVKLHPDFQKFAIDDKHAMEIYEVIGGKLPILFHTGDVRYSYSSPTRLANAAKRFPKQVMIAAHFGGYTEYENGVKYLADLPNVFIDTSSSLEFITPEKAVEYLHIYGVERAFFGTDYPMWSAKEELKRFDRLNLTDSERELIFYKNICKLLGINY